MVRVFIEGGGWGGGVIMHGRSSMITEGLGAGTRIGYVWSSSIVRWFVCVLALLFQSPVVCQHTVKAYHGGVGWHVFVSVAVLGIFFLWRTSVRAFYQECVCHGIKKRADGARSHTN